MKRIARMIITLWPFYVIAFVVFIFIWSLSSKPKPPSVTNSPSPAQTMQEEIKFSKLPASDHLKAIKEELKVNNVKLANKHLRAIPPNTAEYKEAQKAYAERTTKNDVLNKEIGIAHRKRFADEYERNLLDEGMDVHVATLGKTHTTLQIKWILVNRPIIYKMINDETAMGNLRNLGFKKLVMTDGYDSTWNIDVK